MLAYTCFVNANSMYYRHALDYFKKFIKKGNEDIVLLDVEFKLKEIKIYFENIETEEEFYRNISIDEFINYVKNDKDTIKQ